MPKTPLLLLVSFLALTTAIAQEPAKKDLKDLQGRGKRIHPLEPLIAAEIDIAAKLVRAKSREASQLFFPMLRLDEPSKEELATFKLGRPVNRRAFVIATDRKTNKTYEAIVDVRNKKLLSWRHIPGCESSGS